MLLPFLVGCSNSGDGPFLSTRGLGKMDYRRCRRTSGHHESLLQDVLLRQQAKKDSIKFLAATDSLKN